MLTGAYSFHYYHGDAEAQELLTCPVLLWMELDKLIIQGLPYTLQDDPLMNPSQNQAGCTLERRACTCGCNHTLLFHFLWTEMLLAMCASGAPTESESTRDPSLP